jgi:hypothetical protein
MNANVTAAQSTRGDKSPNKTARISLDGQKPSKLPVRRTTGDILMSQEVTSIRRQFDLKTNNKELVNDHHEEAREDTDSTSDHESDCPICKVYVSDLGLLCERCKAWHHASCLYISEDEYTNLSTSPVEWFCDNCSSIRANNIKWGCIEGEDNIIHAVQEAYDEIVKWRKNMFMVPRGKSGSDLIKELTRLIYLFVDKTKWERVALSLVHIFLPVMLQKPNRNSKARDHAKYLTSRLDKWKNGNLLELLRECREIQKRLTQNNQAKQESNRKAFVRLMLVGKVGQAIKFVNNDDNVVGVHTLSVNIKNILASKHPKAEAAHPDALLPETAPAPEEVIFEGITAESIQKSSQDLQGSGGPTQVDTDIWKHMLCSRSYNKASSQLAEAMSNLAKRLCTEHIKPYCLKEFVACRLIPLDKGLDKDGKPGVRPIGIGEVFRRIIGKSVIGVLKADIQDTAGPLQTCAGLRSGIEASIHATRRIWQHESTEALIQVDADNAFNRLNRQVALHNIKQLCPPLHMYLFNHYQNAATLTVNGMSNQETLYSEEGCTQGDVAAMALYALGIKPLVDKLAETIATDTCKQSWYADDSSATGKLAAIKRWWEKLCEIGPRYGYFPKASKTILILKDKALLHEAKSLFEQSGLQITCEGQRHLGAAIGSDDFRTKYVSEKVSKWVEDITELSKIAAEDPQAALSAYTKGICHRWTFIQRTIPEIKELFIPLEDCIRNTLIPAIIGRNVSNRERNIISLPVRFGGLGIANPIENAEREYQASMAVTESLAELIYNQEQDLINYNHEKQTEIIGNLKTAKDKHLLNMFNGILQTLEGSPMKRALELNREKGAGSWLTALPLKSFGYSLNKQEFRDAVCLRYAWKIPNTPPYCGCGKKNSVDHTLICKKGGYVAMRHNNLRDLNEDFQREVCRDVVSEPSLIPLENEEVIGTQADRAAPDISSRGLWSTFERTFYDVRVFHPNSPSYQSKSVEQLYKVHEKEKMRKYANRIMTVEKGSFTPLVYTTFGGWGPQATRYHKRLAEKIAHKRNEDYSTIMSYMRTRVRFSLLRSVLVAVRGERGKKSKDAKPISSTSFNLIPEALQYECY